MSKKKKTKGGSVYTELTKEEALKKYGASFISIGRPISLLPNPETVTSRQRRQSNG